MPQEIERKYLVKGNQWRSLADGVFYRQGYIATIGKETVRIRLIGDRAWLTIKGASQGNTRAEFEYEIPAVEAQEMLDTLCTPPLIEKHRYKIIQDNLTWEIDEFLGENQGLIIAEVELNSEEQEITLPEWIDREVTDPKYYNANLAKHPYSQWEQE